MTEEDRGVTPPRPGDIVAEGEGEAHTALEEAQSAGDEAFQEEMANLQKEIARFKELYLRKLADFDNYRKRQEREMGDFRRFAKAELMRDCLPVLDNLERALAVPGSDGSGLREGVELVLRQFKDVLGRHGLSEVDPMGKAFDPTQHEAIQRIEVEGVTDPVVVQVLQKGYGLGDRLIRPALVIVAVPKAGTAHAGQEQGSQDLGEANGQDHRN